MDESTVLNADYCRHCGAPRPAAKADATVAVQPNPNEIDWLCPKCERYQDSMPCPTCGSIVRASLMPADLVPAAAKTKEK